MNILILDGNSHGLLVKAIIEQYAPATASIELKTVIDKGNHCTNNMLCEGLVYALFSDVDIVNISLGLPNITPEVSSTIDKLVDKGVKVVCASGNYASTYPAKHNRTISVGACDEQGNLRPYTIAGAYDVLECDGMIVKGKKQYGSSFSAAAYTGKLANKEVI